MNSTSSFLEVTKDFVSSKIPRNGSTKSLVYPLLISGGGTAMILRMLYHRHLAKRNSIRIIVHNDGNNPPKKGFNLVFAKKLFTIIRTIIPGLNSQEFLHVTILTVLLFARTWLSVRLGFIVGRNVYSLVRRQWNDIIRGILEFMMLGIPASLANSAMKFETGLLALRFKKRLHERIASQYLTGINFYHANVERRLENFDQRLTNEIEKFCDLLSSIYPITLKPVLDCIVYSFQLYSLSGFRTPLTLYAFAGLTIFAKGVLPSVSKIKSQEAEIESEYKILQQRIMNHSEEIAFHRSKKEKHIVAWLHDKLFKQSRYALSMQGLTGVLVNYWDKYVSSIIGYFLIAYSICRSYSGRTPNVAEAAEIYIRDRQFMINLFSSLSQLVSTPSKLRTLVAATNRVYDLLESVHNLEKKNQIAAYVDEDDKPEYMESSRIEPWLSTWKQQGDLIRDFKNANSSPGQTRRNSNSEGGRIIYGKLVKFDNVVLVSHTGRVLADNLTFECKLTENVMICGRDKIARKTLFRVLGELQHFLHGTIVKPTKVDIIYVSHDPYITPGTLRDQIIYPNTHEDMKKLNIKDIDLLNILDIVDPNRTIISKWKLDETRDWFITLSPRQRQRIAIARLFYHRPLLALLDDCTDLLSEQTEDRIYQVCKQLEITVFTNSARSNLTRYHDHLLNFEGNSKCKIEEIDGYV